MLNEKIAADAEAPATTNRAFFSGISEEWRDFPDAFASEGWVRHCEALAAQLGGARHSSAKALLRRLLRGADVSVYLAMPFRFLRERLPANPSLRVLDVGGGFGDNYKQIRDALGGIGSSMEWHVVDNERSAALGRMHYGTACPNLHLHSEPPGGDFDLAVVVGTLQYIRDWRDFLGSVASGGRPAIYISRSPLRMNGETFLTAQTIYPALGPAAGQPVGKANVWVIGNDDLERAMAEIGYRLQHSRFAGDYSGRFAQLPETHRNVAYIDQLWVPR